MFWFRFVVGVISVLLPPVFGLVIRHKWRKAVERREEIRKLLCVLAAEEADLADYRYDYDVEFERNGNYGYGYVGGVAGEVEAQIPVEVRETKGAGGEAEVAMPGRSSQKVKHRCATCSHASNYKCSRCKSVYYCSGECQISHWRQGHKYECQLSKREENGTGDNVLGTGEDSKAKPAGTLNNSFPDSGISAVHSRKDECQLSKREENDTGDNVLGTGEDSRAKPAETLNNSFPDSGISAFKSSMQKVDVFKGFFPYDLFVKLYNGKQVEFRPPGFLNCGNSCYVNVVLNCLASTPPLTSYFLQGLHSKSCEKKDWCFTCEFESLMSKAKDSVSPVSPIRIISHLQNIGSHLTNGRQEDAHEFLRYAIDSMQSTCLTEAGVQESDSLKEGTTSAGLTFGGIIRSKIECMRCRGVSERQERMMDLTVEIDGHIGTLEEALKKYTSAEILDGDNKYKCGRCESYEKAKKKLQVMEAPNILTIALKRYQPGELGKLNKKVQFPEVLNLAPYVCGTSDKSPIYGLYGVIVHLDTKNSTFSGHYVCYVKNTQNQWFKADDRAVKSVKIGDVLTQDAYMLLYARYSPRAPGLIRSSIIPQDPREKGHLCKSRSFSRTSWSVSTCEDPACHQGTATNPNPTCGSSIDNSTFFSEGGSKGTESSNMESAISDDHFDYGVGAYWNISRRSSSDSDASSSSSSSSSPLSLRQSPLADASRSPSMTEHGSKSYGTWRSSSLRDLENTHCEEDYRFRQPDLSEHIKRFTSSSSENKRNRLGRMNPFEKLKLGFPFRRPTNYRQVAY